MPLPQVLSTNLGRAWRLVLHADRMQRARNFVAWQKHLARLRRRQRRWQRNRELLNREMAELRPVLASHPRTLTIDPASLCNLRCPFCPTGAGFGDFPRTLLTPERFGRIVGNLDPDLLERVELYNWGEPLLNPHLLEFVRFFSERRVVTEVSTNFSQRDYEESYLGEMVRSGLTTLVVSIDGATQATYERYRVRGNLERVLGNLSRLAAVKRELGSDTPAVFFKMLLNRHNQHEVEQARRLAADRGALFLLNERFWCPDEHAAEWQVRGGEGVPAVTTIPQVPLGEGITSTYCRQLWESVVVTATGDVHPCCLTYESRHAIGNLAEQPLAAIRNGERAVYLRRLVSDPSTPPPAFDNGCECCPGRWCTAHRRGASA